MRGERVEARRLVESSLKTYEDLGIPLALAGVLGFERAGLNMIEKNFPSAEHDRRRAVQLLQAHGEKDVLVALSALLAAALCAQGKDVEAEQLLQLSDSGGEHDWVRHMLAKEVQAELHARRGEFDEALQLARQALTHVESTDDIEGQAHAMMQLAKMLSWSGNGEEAIPLLKEAGRLFEAKGHLVKADLADAALKKLEPTGRRSEPTWLTMR